MHVMTLQSRFSGRRSEQPDSTSVITTVAGFDLFTGPGPSPGTSPSPGPGTSP